MDILPMQDDEKKTTAKNPETLPIYLFSLEIHVILSKTKQIKAIKCRLRELTV
jgi:hypothetical protein